MSESSGLARPRGLPRTLLHIGGLLLLGGLSGAIVLSLVVIPTIVPIIFAEIPGLPMYAAYFGVFLALSFGGVGGMKDSLYTPSDDTPSGGTSPSDIVQQISEARALLLLAVLYINIVFAGTLAFTALVPAWGWYIAVIAPIIDRSLLTATGYSPALVPIVLLASILEATQVVSDIDLDAIRTLNPAVVAGSPRQGA